MTSDWPEGAFYGLDQVYGTHDLGYRGTSFTGFRTPDQYTLSALERLEHGRHDRPRSEEHTSELQSRPHLVCRLLLEKKKTNHTQNESERRKKCKQKCAEARTFHGARNQVIHSTHVTQRKHVVPRARTGLRSVIRLAL